jgi:hypothetical protein
MTGASRWILFTTIIVDARNHEPEIKFSSTNCISPYYVKRPLPLGDNQTAVNKYYYYYYYPSSCIHGVDQTF